MTAFRYCYRLLLFDPQGDRSDIVKLSQDTEVIKQLKSRRALDELLVKVYFRELLNMVSAQADKDGGSTLSSLY